MFCFLACIIYFNIFKTIIKWDHKNWSFIKCGSLTLSTMGLFGGGAHGWRGVKRQSIHKICHTYSTMIKLCMVTPYIKKNQKICKSCDAHFEFYRYQYFFTRNQQLLLYYEIQIQIVF